MGYRHYLEIIETDKLKNLTEDFINKQKDEDGYLFMGDLLKSLGGECIYELGKYSEEGSYLECKKNECPEEIKTQIELLMKVAEEDETGFNILTKEDLIYIINSYKKRTLEYLKSLIDKESEEKAVKLYAYVKDKLAWSKFMVDIDPEHKYNVQGTWNYEYAIFDLIHCLKVIDWDKYTLVIYGY